MEVHHNDKSTAQVFVFVHVFVYIQYAHVKVWAEQYLFSPQQALLNLKVKPNEAYCNLACYFMFVWLLPVSQTCMHAVFLLFLITLRTKTQILNIIPKSGFLFKPCILLI